jgi:hypothetical protein
MEEFFRFIQRSERERNSLIQETRASVFPPASISEQSNTAPISHAISDVSAFREDGVS